MKRMTFTKQISAAVVFSAIAVSGVQAQDVRGWTQGWSGFATLGANSVTGNVEADNVNASIRLGKTAGSWEHVVFGSYFRGTSTILVDRVENGAIVTTTLPNGDIVNAQDVLEGGNSNRLAIGYTPRFYWRPRTYFFGIIDYEQDKPANIKLASRQLIGIGHKFFANDTSRLSAEAGFGNRALEAVAGEDADGGLLYFGAEYLNNITDNVTFDAAFRADLGDDNNFTQIDLGLAFKVSEKFSVKIAHQTRANSDIENPALPDPSETDSSTSINLVVDL